MTTRESMTDIVPKEVEKIIPKKADRVESQGAPDIQIPQPEAAQPVLPAEQLPPKKEEKFDFGKMVEGLIEEATYPITPTSPKFEASKLSQYEAQRWGGMGVHLVDKTSGEVVAQMGFESSEYDSKKEYQEKKDGPYNVLYDQETGREVARVLRTEGGADIDASFLFNPAWKLDRLRQATIDVLAGFEIDDDGMEEEDDRLLKVDFTEYDKQLEFYQVKKRLTAKERQEFRSIRAYFKARFLLEKCNAALRRGNADIFEKEVGGNWGKELFEALWRIKGVPETIKLVEDSNGADFRHPDRDKRKLQDVILRVKDRLKSNHPELSDEEARLAVATTVKLCHLTAISTQYVGHQEKGISAEQGILNAVQSQIVEKEFNIKGQKQKVNVPILTEWDQGRNGYKINMVNDLYWRQWDLYRREHNLGLGDLPGALPYLLGKIILTPEFLKRRSSVRADGLRRVCETRVRSLAYYSGVTTLSELYQVRNQIYFYGWAQTVKGASGLVDKLESGFLFQPVNAPGVAFDHPEKITEILKPFFDLRENFNYISYSGDTQQPNLMRAYVLGQLIKYINSDEGQRLFTLKRPTEAIMAWVVNKLSFGKIPEDKASEVTGAYRRWGEIQIFEAFDSARNNLVINEEAFNILLRSFGVSRVMAALKRGAYTAVKETGGASGDILRHGTGGR